VATNVIYPDSNSSPIKVTLTDTFGTETVGIDSFGRMRVGQAYTLADLILKYEIDTRDWGQQTVTGGSIAHVPNEQAARLTVTGANAASAVLQTHTYFRYQAGKAQWIRQTLYHADAGQANQRRRWGYFDAQNGLFFQLSGTTLSVVRRTYTSGSAVETTVSQASWNYDKMDGTGPSGMKLDLTKAQIYEIEFQHLAVGNVWFRINGVLVHEMIHAGQLSVPYMTTAQLPVRIEVTNTAASTGSSLTYICTSVESHGGSAPPEESFGAANTTSVTISNTEIPVLAIRLKSTYNSITNRMNVLPVHLHLSGLNAQQFYFRLLMNPTTLLNGAINPTWVSADDRSGVEYTTNATVFTGGQMLFSGVLTGIESHSENIDTLFNTLGRRLRMDAFGTTSDVLLVTAIRIGGGDASGRFNLHWNEVR
jgi:hypothetical protein